MLIPAELFEILKKKSRCPVSCHVSAEQQPTDAATNAQRGCDVIPRPSENAKHDLYSAVAP